MLRITTAAKTATITAGGLPRALISSKCGFFNCFTFSKVTSKDAFASATEFSAFSAKSCASNYYFIASFSSNATNFCYFSASAFYIDNVVIISSDSSFAFANYGCISVSLIFISATAAFASINF